MEFRVAEMGNNHYHVTSGDGEAAHSFIASNPKDVVKALREALGLPKLGRPWPSKSVQKRVEVQQANEGKYENQNQSEYDQE